MKEDLKKFMTAALMAALTCAMTLSVRIPTVGTGGYIHPGDAIVILCGVVLGPAYGFLAGGIGSALADFLGGYLIYAPFTFVIKGAVALAAGLIYNRFGKGKVSRWVSVILGGISDIALVAGGYFIFEACLYGVAAAAVTVPANLVQGISGMVISCILYPVIIKIPGVSQLRLPKTHGHRAVQ